MSDHEWHDVTSYNLIMPRKSMIKLYNIKSKSQHHKPFTLVSKRKYITYPNI